MKEKLEKLKKDELIALAGKLGIKNCSKWPKAELIKAIREKKKRDGDSLTKLGIIVTIIVGILGIIAAIIISDCGKKFGSIVQAKIDNNVVIAYDKNGNQWRRPFSTEFFLIY